MSFASNGIRGSTPGAADVSPGQALPREIAPAAPAPARHVDEHRARAAVSAKTHTSIALRAPRRVARGPVLAGNVEVPRSGLASIYELDYYDGRLNGLNARFDVPEISAAQAAGLARMSVAADYKNVIMPNGVEVAHGRGGLTLLMRGREVVGVLEGSASFSLDAAFVDRQPGRIARTAAGFAAQLESGGFLTDTSGSVVGLAPHSTGVFDGTRISAGDDAVTVREMPRDRFSLGGPATVLAMPADRAIAVGGSDVSVRMVHGSYDLANGSVVVRNNGASMQIESGALRAIRTLSAPPVAADQRREFDTGEITLKRIDGGQLYVDGISDRDFDQGSTGDCWLVGSILAIAATRPELLRRLITDNHDNTYTIHFFRDGRWTSIDVDDAFYQYGDGQAHGGAIVYGHSRDPHELWGPLLEKANAAVFPGGYEGIYGGWPADAFRKLTGYESKLVRHDSLPPDMLFAQLTRAAAARLPMVAVAGKPYKDRADESRLDAEATAQWGLHNYHAYAVLGTRVENGERYVLLRNTARGVEFKANGYDSDIAVDGKSAPADGYFRVRLDDYIKHFESTTTLQLPSGA